jgi:hypothetical protein
LSLLVLVLASTVSLYLLRWKGEMAGGVGLLLTGVAVSLTLSASALKRFRAPIVELQAKLLDQRMEVIEGLPEVQLLAQKRTNEQLELLRLTVLHVELARSATNGAHASATAPSAEQS